MNPHSATLDVSSLDVTYAGGARALRDVSLTIQPGERVAVIGESGCGKTTLIRTLLGLLPSGARVKGRVLVGSERNLVGAKESSLRELRGRTIAYVPQNPLSAWDPLRSVASQIGEAWRCHGLRCDRAEIVDLLTAAGIADAASLIERRPSAWSGGMLQRASIIGATALHPKIVLADEPTSAVDRPLARRMLALLSERSESLLVVTHDIDLIAGAVDRVLVMYAGRIVEDRPADALLTDPHHPYSLALMAALPRPGKLPSELPGDPPRLDEPDSGCAFAPRCPRASILCREQPAMQDGVVCHHPGSPA